MKLFIILFIVTGLAVVSMTGIVYAQSSYDINIPTGAASPDAPYFWQNEKDGSTTGDIDIIMGDKVVWKNADTAAHTVTSGTPTDGPDGIFDSGLFAPGKSFPFTFKEKGIYPYYCLVHPWMTGTVFVTEGFSILPNVGQDVGDGKTTFDVEYDFNRLLSSATVNEDTKSITFQISGNAKSDDHHLSLRLPVELIDGPFAIWADGEKVSDFESVRDNDLNVLDLELTKDTKEITIIGTSVVPEFGMLSVVILGMSFMALVLFGQRIRFNYSL